MKWINLNKYNRKDGLRIRKFNDEYYMLCSGKCYEINETGAIVIKYISKDMTIETLSNKIAETYSVCVVDKISEDINSFIDFLLSEGLINQHE